MEVFVAIVRQNHCDLFIHNTNQYKSSTIQVFLLSKNNEDGEYILKLPSVLIHNEVSASQEIINNLSNFNNIDTDLIGKRVISVPSLSVDEPKFYCAIVTDNIESLQIMKSLEPKKKSSFYNLDDFASNLSILEQFSQYFIKRLDIWFKNLRQKQGLLHLLFSNITEERLSWSIMNPMYSSRLMPRSSLSGSYRRRLCSKMLHIDKCNITVINPLHQLKTYDSLIKVDLSIVNNEWGKTSPDYSLLLPQVNQHNFPAFFSGSFSGKHGTILNSYPLHEAAKNGQLEIIKKLIAVGYLPQQKDKFSFTPLHYAAQYGNVEVIELLLNIYQCDPNILDQNKHTPLHIAAIRGQLKSAESLLKNKLTNINMLNKDNRTPLELVERLHASQIIQSFKSILGRSLPIVRIFLMDGTCRYVYLYHNNKTTAHQLLVQIIQILNIPVNYSKFLAIWVCSKGLQFQLLEEHHPMEYLENWKNYFEDLTRMNSEYEIPELFVKRNSEILPADEIRIDNTIVQYLLYIEAYHNYIQSLYPCSEVDAVMLGAIFLHINRTNLPNTEKINYFSEVELKDYIPARMLFLHNLNYWNDCIIEQYQGIKKNFKNCSLKELYRNFLFICRNLKTYGSAFFTGSTPLKNGKHAITVYLAVNDVGLHLISLDSRKSLKTFEYSKIVWKVQVHMNQYLLEITTKLKKNSESIYIVTNQAGLIDNLMKKFYKLVK